MQSSTTAVLATSVAGLLLTGCGRHSEELRPGLLTATIPLNISNFEKTPNSPATNGPAAFPCASGQDWSITLSGVPSGLKLSEFDAGSGNAAVVTMGLKSEAIFQCGLGWAATGFTPQYSSDSNSISFTLRLPEGVTGSSNLSARIEQYDNERNILHVQGHNFNRPGEKNVAGSTNYSDPGSLLNTNFPARTGL